MRTALQFASIITCAISVQAQISAVVKTFPARGPEIEIRNDSSVNLTAFAVSMAPVARGAADGAPFLVYVDTAFDGDRQAMPYQLKTAMPPPPGQEYGVGVPDRHAIGIAAKFDGHRPVNFSVSRLVPPLKGFLTS
jgi:hypothetical protein